MPTYHYYCETCDEDSLLWQSIHADAITLGDCGHDVVKVIDSVTTLHIGRSGQEAITADAIEARWDRDMPAYKRLRKEGHQPPHVDGSAELEATAQSDIWIRSGGRMKYSDELVRESKAYAEDIIREGA